MRVCAVPARAGKLGDQLAQQRINSTLQVQTEYAAGPRRRRCTALVGLCSTVSSLMKHPRSVLTLHEKELEYLNERLLKLGDDPATEQNWLDFAETQVAEVVTTTIHGRRRDGEGVRVRVPCNTGCCSRGHG